GPTWGFRSEEIRLDVPMLVGRVGGSLRVGLIEDAKREQPQHDSREGDYDPIAASLDRTSAQCSQDAGGAQPCDHVVANRHDRRLLRPGQRSLQCEKAGDGRADLIEAGPVGPGALLAVHDDRGVDQSRLLGAEVLGIQAMPTEESWTLVGKEDIGTL